MGSKKKKESYFWEEANRRKKLPGPSAYAASDHPDWNKKVMSPSCR